MTRYENVWRILTLHCDEASRLSSESLDHDLAGTDRVAWRVHLLLCGECRQHLRDILAIRTISRDLDPSIDRAGEPLPESDRERIKRSLREDQATG